MKRFLPLSSVVGIALTLVFLAGCGKEENPLRPKRERIDQATYEHYLMQDVKFSTVDGLNVGASWGAPARPTQKWPALILIHHWAGDRNQWMGFIPTLLDSGYAVLTIDIRGHGETILPGGRELQADDLELMPLDVAGAISWLSTQEEVDPSRIGVVGANIGANIAYVSSGMFGDKVKTAVVLSPQYGEVLIGKGIPNFRPHSILFMAAESDFDAVPSAQTMANLTAEPSQVVVLRNTSVHGIEILAAVPEALAVFFDWLRRTL